jgi:hypothetical protein
MHCVEEQEREGRRRRERERVGGRERSGMKRVSTTPYLVPQNKPWRLTLPYRPLKLTFIPETQPLTPIIKWCHGEPCTVAVDCLGTVERPLLEGTTCTCSMIDSPQTY